MTISYNWLSEYLPEAGEVLADILAPEKLSKILTSIGLEVESLDRYESIRGGLEGVVIGEVLTCEPHPNADKLKITQVNIGAEKPLQVVCGAANVAAGQKVAVATIGTTIYPAGAEPLTMKLAKIRGMESQGMICAEDELGLGTSHEGIMVLPTELVPGTPAADYFKPYSDWIYEIGLTPNRMDAMSHFGVAKDLCAYISHHHREVKPRSPFADGWKADNQSLPVKVVIENQEDCQRYAGVSITGVTVKESPQWLKNRLNSIGLRPINNIVDITNFILHETGQPLHAFDAAAIAGKTVIIKNLAEDTAFITLDEKERKLSREDLMICNAREGMCIAGVFGGLNSGVKEGTTAIFLESAWFNPVSIRKTSVRHGLRTDAATRFEKGVDIANPVNVLKRAALMIKEIAGGQIASEIVDVYPDPKPKKEVALKNHYLKKLSGKNYHPDKVKRILTGLGFEIIKEGLDELVVAVPYSKPDISIPADIVEEVVRIDGLDNIDIPAAITISPAVDQLGVQEALKDKVAACLVGQGFTEILTNSITNSRYFENDVLSSTVKMMNNLSAELDVLRPSMLETGLETIAYNINRKNNDLRLFEFGKTYAVDATGGYREQEHLCLYLTGKQAADGWRSKHVQLDIYAAKGIAKAVAALGGLTELRFTKPQENSLLLELYHGKQLLGTVEEVSTKKLRAFDLRQPVYFIDFQLAALLKAAGKHKIVYKEVSKFPAVHRDLAMVVGAATSYEAMETVVHKLKLPRLQDMQLFDVFESDKLGEGKKSVAISFTFMDEEKTLTDKEVDAMIVKLVQGFEKELGAEIRK
jgi:phenylalanyl-tRNA synthetase beta chain